MAFGDNRSCITTDRMCPIGDRTCPIYGVGCVKWRTNTKLAIVSKSVEMQLNNLYIIWSCFCYVTDQGSISQQLLKVCPPKQIKNGRNCPSPTYNLYILDFFLYLCPKVRSISWPPYYTGCFIAVWPKINEYCRYTFSPICDWMVSNERGNNEVFVHVLYTI